MIRERKIFVNRSLAVFGIKVNPDFDNIFINGKELRNLNTKSQIICQY